MKVLIIQENGRHEKNRNYRECFSLKRAFEFNGWAADVWGLNHANWSILPNFDSYDLIFTLENYDLTGWLPDLSKIKRPYKVLWAIDAHSRGTHPYENIFKNGKYDLLLHSTLDYVDNNSKIWFPNCFDSDLVKYLALDKISDVGFCGEISNRGDFLIRLDQQKEFSFKKDIFVIGDDMVKVINGYKIHFNKNWGNDINYRNFETIACRTALLTNKNYQYEILGFKDEYNCFFYDGFEDFIDKAKWILKNDLLRYNVAKRGLDLSIKHSYTQRVKKFIDFLKEKI